MLNGVEFERTHSTRVKRTRRSLEVRCLLWSSLIWILLIYPHFTISEIVIRPGRGLGTEATRAAVFCVDLCTFQKLCL